MTRAIQSAYYEQARNPSDDETLIRLADDLGLDVERFTEQYNNPSTQKQLEKEIEFAHAMGVNGFPSLVLQVATANFRIPISYREAQPVISTLEKVLVSD